MVELELMNNNNLDDHDAADRATLESNNRGGSHEEERVIGGQDDGGEDVVSLEGNGQSPAEDGPEEDESPALLDEGPETHLEEDTVSQVRNMGVVGKYHCYASFH